MDHFLLCLTLLYSTFSFTGGTYLTLVTAAEGQSSTLPCFTFRPAEELRALRWTHLDRHKDLLLFRGGRVLDGQEAPEFRGRVQLLDPHLLSTNLSVVLRNITVEDRGVIECQAERGDIAPAPQYIHLVVIVTDDGRNGTVPPFTDTTTIGTNTQRGFPGLFCGLGIGLGLLFIIVFITVLRCVHRTQKSGKCVPSDSEKCPDIKDTNPPLKPTVPSLCSDGSMCFHPPSLTSVWSSAGLLQTSEKHRVL